MGIGRIFENIVDTVTGRNNDQENAPQQPTDFGDQAADPNDADQGILPASMDPLGDPADEMQNDGGILPASMDPMGDPADGPQYGNAAFPANQQDADQGILPASMDPLGDPADQQQTHRQ